MARAIRTLVTFVVIAVNAVCLLGVPALHAQSLRPAADKEMANITDQARYLRDGTGDITLRDIVRPAAQRGLKTLKQPYLETSIDDNQSTHWFKFQAIAPPDQNYRAILYFTDRDVSEFIAFVQVFGANADVLRYASGRNKGDAVEKTYGIGLPIEVKAGEKRNIFVSVRGDGLSGRLELWQPDALQAHVKQQNQSGLGAVIFVASGIVLTLILAFVYKQVIWCALAVATALYTLAFASARGLYPIPLMDLSADWQLFLKSTFAALVLLFAGNLSSLGSRFAPLGWFGTALSAATFASGILGFFAPPQADIVIYLAIVFAAVMCIGYAATLVSLKSVQRWKRRGVQALLSAPLILLALPLPAQADVIERLPILAVVAFVALICGVEVVRFGRDRVKYAEIEGSSLVSLRDVSSKAAQDAAETPDRPAKTRDDVVISAKTDEPQEDQQQAALEAALRVTDSATKDASQSAPVELPPLGQLPDTAYDKMTGVFSRTTLEAIGEKTLLQVRRYGRPTCAIMLKLDDYQSLMESGGRSTADRAAKLLSVTCMRELRESDYLGRLEDSVFVALLPETTLEGATVALRRACENLAERTLPTRAGMLRLRPSIAARVVTADHGDFDMLIEDLSRGLARADLSLTGEQPL